MNPPPDVYDADGHPYEDRRKAIRREDDLDPAASRGYEFWAKLMFLHKGKFLAFASALVGTGGYLLGLMGAPRDLKALTLRVTALEANQTGITKRLDDVVAQATLTNVLLCTMLDGKGTPIDGCRSVLSLKATR